MRPIGVIILIGLLGALIYSQRQTLLRGLADEVQKELALPQPEPEVLRGLGADLDSLMQEGDRAFEAGDLRVAEDVYRQAARLDTTAAWPYANLATIRAASGDPEGAVENWRRAVSRRPGHTGYLTNLGAAYAQTGRSREAVAVWERVIREDPYNDTVRELIAKEMAESASTRDDSVGTAR